MKKDNITDLFDSISKEVDVINRYIDKRFEKLTPEQGGALTISLAGEAMIRVIVSQGWSLDVAKKFLEESIYPQAIVKKMGRMQ